MILISTGPTEMSPLLPTNLKVQQSNAASVSNASGNPVYDNRKWSQLSTSKLVLFLAMCIAVPLIWNLPRFDDSRYADNSSQGLLQPLQHFDGLKPKQLSEVTMGDLAKATLPGRYTDMVKQLSIFDNETIHPIETAEVRKVILKTRDMLDVFSPVYPDTDLRHSKNVDIWGELRIRIAHGYQVIGEFLDFDHAHMMYSSKEEDKLRTKILVWRSSFLAFEKKHKVSRYLSHPSRDHDHFEHRKESRFFWKDWKSKRPRGYSSAVKSLAGLGQQQVEVILGYYREVFPEVSVLEVDVQEVYHNVRKALRAMIDENEILGKFMFPEDSGVEDTMNMMVLAKKYLGDMNDNWTARQHYIEKNEYPDEQVRLAELVDRAWDDFKKWSIEVRFEASLQALSDRLEDISGIKMVEKKR